MLLITSDNEQFIVERDVLQRMQIFASQDVAWNPEPASEEPIPVPNVSSPVMRKVLEYCEYHRNDPLPSQRTDNDDPRRRQMFEIGEWDQKFIQVDREMLFEIILAANFLDIQDLLDVSCKTVAGLIKNKTPEEIRKLFNIVDDFTPEEQAQIQKENEWAEDR
ncbi:hypothetical protein FRC09_000403 [Ceratobasidium sp. 395]|nr:hypothetical protein FRC09_000403 [Ceratobasidium sp. 395]